MSWIIVNKGRKGWIDALRGLAILLVIYGHSINKDMLDFFVYTSPFKMPLFFAISGYLFSTKKDWPTFLVSTFWKLIVPWLFLGLLPLIVTIPFKGVDNVLVYFLNMLSGEVNWFMPCFIISEVLFYTITRYCKKTGWIAIAAFSCFVLGLFLHQKGILNYAMFNRALVVQLFFLIGYVFRLFESKFISITWFWIGLAVVIYIVLCYFSTLLFPGLVIDVHMNRYYNIPYCLLLIILSCLLCFTIASKLNMQSQILSFIGQNTLVLYMWHGVFITILIKGLLFLGWAIPTNAWTALLKTIWACLTCGLCGILLNNKLPWAVGKKRINSNDK